MAYFTVLTDDDSLIARIHIGLADRDRVFQVRGGFEAPLPRPSAEPDIVVIDLRRLDRAAVSSVVDFRRRLPDDRRVVGIVGDSIAPCVEVVMSEGVRDIDFILSAPQHAEHLGNVLRAIANDHSLTVCAAATLEVLQELLKPVARAVTDVVLASGCSIHRAKDVAGKLRRSLTSLRAQLDNEGSPHPAAVIHRAQCAYALALARRSSLTVRQLAAFSRLGKDSRFHQHCRTHIGARAKMMAREWPDLDLRAFLRRALARDNRETDRVVSGGGRALRASNLPPPPRDKRSVTNPLRELPDRPVTSSVAA